MRTIPGGLPPVAPDVISDCSLRPAEPAVKRLVYCRIAAWLGRKIAARPSTGRNEHIANTNRMLV